MILSLSIIFSLCVPVLATGVASDIDQNEDFFGYTFDEHMDEDGNYIIISYYNGQIQSRYTIGNGEADILVEKIESGIWENTYTISNAVTVPIVPMADRWASAGSIYYKDSASVGTVQAIMMAYGTTRSTELELNVPSNSPFDDVVAFISSFLISEGLAKWAMAAGASVSTYGASLLMAVISSLGSSVINGLIVDAFIETVPAIETEWKFKATPKIGNTFGTSAILEDQGQSFLIYLPDQSEWDNQEEGVTLYNWASLLFAQTVWDALFSDAPCPGVERFVSTF